MTRTLHRYRLCRAIVTALVVALATVLGTACSRDAPDPGRTDSPAPLFGHVHGLGIDPADGRLYVATHFGLFREAGGRLEKVGASAPADRDLMGFLVVGPGTFLASGHPSPDEVVTPNPLGLVRSTDGGTSWQAVSLSGQVDFHALDQGPGGTYGVDAEGVLRTSTDGSRWEETAAPPALDVAADPARADRVALAVVGGVALTDRGGGPVGGPSPFLVQPGPQLVYLSWAPDGELFGLGPDGLLFSSPDGGFTWLPRGSVPGGRPQALAAVGRGRVLAATPGGISESRDGGRTFTAIAAGTP